MNNYIEGIIQFNKIITENDILILNEYWFSNINKIKITLPKVIISPFEYAFTHIPSFIQMLGIPLMFLNANKIECLKNGQHVFVDFDNNDVFTDLPFSHNIKNDEILPANSVLFYSSIKGEKTDFSLINRSDGVGLISTEFLFYRSKNISKKYQYKILNEICAQNSELEYTIRLFDISADKVPLWAYRKYPCITTNIVGSTEHLSIADNIDSLFDQLAVIEELSKKYKIAILVPYLTDVEEILKIKTTVKQYLSKNIRFGAMIETLDILPTINEVNKVVDFYSLGTNDIIQSFFKIDRTKPICFDDINLKDEKFLKILHDILNQIQDKSIRVCGQLPIIPDMLCKLIEIGYKQFTVNPYWINYLKKIALKYIN